MGGRLRPVPVRVVQLYEHAVVRPSEHINRPSRRRTRHHGVGAAAAPPKGRPFSLQPISEAGCRGSRRRVMQPAPPPGGCHPAGSLAHCPAAKRRLNNGPGWSEAKPRVTSPYRHFRRKAGPPALRGLGWAKNQPLATAGPSQFAKSPNQSQDFKKNIPCVFNTSRPPGKNTPNSYAILITVNQSDHKPSWINQEKQNCALRGPKNPHTLTFSVKNCNLRYQSTETKRLKRLTRNHATTPSVAL